MSERRYAYSFIMRSFSEYMEEGAYDWCLLYARDYAILNEHVWADLKGQPRMLINGAPASVARSYSQPLIMLYEDEHDLAVEFKLRFGEQIAQDNSKVFVG